MHQSCCSAARAAVSDFISVGGCVGRMCGICHAQACKQSNACMVEQRQQLGPPEVGRLRSHELLPVSLPGHRVIHTGVGVEGALRARSRAECLVLPAAPPDPHPPVCMATPWRSPMRCVECPHLVHVQLPVLQHLLAVAPPKAPGAQHIRVALTHIGGQALREGGGERERVSERLPERTSAGSGAGLALGLVLHTTHGPPLLLLPVLAVFTPII